MKDFLTFRKMLLPVLIQILFWVGSLICLAAGMVLILGKEGVFRGLEVIIIGPFLLRLFCEGFIVFFSINTTLLEIKDFLRRKTE